MHRTKIALTALASIASIALLSAGCSSKPNDAQLVTNIQSQMFADAQLKSASLQVASFGGQVTIKGSVPNDAARYEAYKIATQTPGVTKVIDQMLVGDQTAQAAPDANTSPVVPSAPVAPTPAPAVAAVKPPKPAPHAKPHPTQQPSPDQISASQSNQSAQNAPPSSDASAAPSAPAVADQSAPAPTPPSAPPAAPPAPLPPQPRQYEVAAGTTVSIRMIDSIDSSVNAAGEMFHASLDAPIVVGNDVVAPKGADIYVRLTSASSAGKLSGQSELRLELVKLELQGQSFPLVSATYSQVGASRSKDTAKKVGGGAVLGAIIGAVAGGGKGAAIGGAVGAGAGGVYQGATHGQQVKIPSETKLDFTLDQPAEITVQPAPPSNS